MGPLAGLRIVEMAAIGPAPMASMLLCDLGAEVIRIDRLEQGVPIFEMDKKFEVVSRGRQSIAVDLKQPAGVELVLRLVASSRRADRRLPSPASPSVWASARRLLARNPKPGLRPRHRLGAGRPAGQGRRARRQLHLADRRAYAIGKADAPPTPPLNLVGDFGGGGMLLAVGVLAALLEAQKSGKGQVVDAAMTDGAAFLMAALYGMHVQPASVHRSA
jgi:alpha-methylacyl-CoA racemase